MCTPMSPPEQICDDCRSIYLVAHNPGDLTFDQVDQCDDIEQLRLWGAGKCDGARYQDIPQLCPADLARYKVWVADEDRGGQLTD